MFCSRPALSIYLGALKKQKALAQCGPPRLSETPREYEARIIERMEKNQEARLKGLVRTLALSGQIEGVR